MARHLLFSFLIIIGTLLLTFVTECFAEENAASHRSITFPIDPFSFQPGPGQEIANSYCVICHSADYIYMQPPHSQERWIEIIKKMKHTFGCPIPNDSITPLAGYLTTQKGLQPAALYPTNIPRQSSSLETDTGNPIKGKSVYVANCINCHGTTGQGDGPIGQVLVPPAADLTALSEKTDKELLTTIRNGRPGTAMPSWKDHLSAQDLTDVLSYVRKLSLESAPR